MTKYALITGSTSGIGLATAKVLADAGYTLLLNGLSEDLSDEAKQKLGDAEYKYFRFDVTQEDEILKAFEEINKNYDHLDVVVNNAGGLGGRSRFEDMETSFYRHVMALNLDSAFFVSRSAIPLLKKSDDNPTIINLTSIAGWNGGGPGAGIYGTSKGAVTLLTRALAKDLAEYGIRVNAVSPGTIDTPFHQATKDANPDLFNSWKNNILMKRFGEAEEVATVIEFLISDKASFLTGEVIQINGGQAFL